MFEPTSELVAIARLNGEFRRNYGRLIGAILYLSSISAIRRRPFFWTAVWGALVSVGLAWLKGHGASWFRLVERTRTRDCGNFSHQSALHAAYRKEQLTEPLSSRSSYD